MIEIVPLTVDRVDKLLEIEQEVYPNPWTRQTFLDELAAPQRVYLVALIEGEVVGYGGIMLVTEEAHITTVVTRPVWRRARVATRLMLELISRAIQEGIRSLTLEVRSSNQAAQALYWRFGMAPVGVRKKYYVSEDALIMWVHGLDTPEYRTRLTRIAADLP